MSFLNSIRLFTRNGTQLRNKSWLLSETVSAPLCSLKLPPHTQYIPHNVFSSHVPPVTFSKHFCTCTTLSTQAKPAGDSSKLPGDSSKIPDDSLKDDAGSSKEDEKSLTVFQRFTQVYKEYGKTLIGVHIVTSIAWYGAFYIIARSGIDLLPLLIKFGASEAIQSKYSAAGDYVVAYILYEIAKPVRYLATLAITRQAVVYMRNRGYLPPIKPEDKLRNLAKDGRDNLKDKYQERKDDMKDRYAKTKVVYQTRLSKYRRKGTNGKHLHRNTGSHLHRNTGSHLHRNTGSPLHKSNGVHKVKKVSETTRTRPPNK